MKGSRGDLLTGENTQFPAFSDSPDGCEWVGYCSNKSIKCRIRIILFIEICTLWIMLLQMPFTASPLLGSQPNDDNDDCYSSYPSVKGLAAELSVFYECLYSEEISCELH